MLLYVSDLFFSFRSFVSVIFLFFPFFFKKKGFWFFSIHFSSSFKPQRTATCRGDGSHCPLLKQKEACLRAHPSSTCLRMATTTQSLEGTTSRCSGAKTFSSGLRSVTTTTYLSHPLRFWLNSRTLMGGASPYPPGRAPPSVSSRTRKQTTSATLC